jgi:hypothetical protein
MSKKTFTVYFLRKENLRIVINADSFTEAQGQQQGPNEWRLFIDSSKLCLKAVLIHNGNKYHSNQTEQAVHMKKSYNRDLVKHIYE